MFMDQPFLLWHVLRQMGSAIRISSFIKRVCEKTAEFNDVPRGISPEDASLVQNCGDLLTGFSLLRVQVECKSNCLYSLFGPRYQDNSVCANALGLSEPEDSFSISVMVGNLPKHPERWAPALPEAHGSKSMLACYDFYGEFAAVLPCDCSFKGL